MIQTNKIYNGDSVEVLRTFPDQCIDVVITSPPYYNLRDYHHEKQIGKERSPKDYIDKLIAVFTEVKRTLKDTGALWVNIGDTHDDNKSLIGIPERLALAIQDELKMIRRNTIIWYKPACMPSSAMDRFTVDFEYLYFFTKKPKGYYFKTQYTKLSESMQRVLERQQYYNGKAKKNYSLQEIQNPSDTKRRIISNMIEKSNNGRVFIQSNPSSPHIKNLQRAEGGAMRNHAMHSTGYSVATEGALKRCVWIVTPDPYTGNHFAAYPEDLIRTPIDACCPPDGIVLDPFNGSGTTCITAKKMNRKYVGIDLNPEYVKQAESRLASIL